MNERELASFILGESPAIEQLRATIIKAASASVSVLIEGPTGSGKELVAQALHKLSGRSGAFVPFNVCAIPETMLETSLFGHVRGAFTGATRDARGYLAEADRGTAFFDEISGLPLHAQVKLLRALELKEFRPVGATRDVRSDFRLVAATNEDLRVLVSTNRFRADLAHRLRGVIIRVPPLAERLEDIPALVRHFLPSHREGSGSSVSDRAIEALQSHSWPGNVRELRQVVARAATMATSSDLIASDVIAAIESESSADASARMRQPSDSVENLTRLILSALDLSGGDTAKAALRLTISRGTLYRWMKQLGIRTPRRRRIAVSPPEDTARAIPAIHTILTD